MKLKNLIDEYGWVREQYQYDEDCKTIDFNKISEIIEDIKTSNISFVDHEKWIVNIENEDGRIYEYEMENYENHPEIVYIIIKYLKNMYKEFINLYATLPAEYKLKLELED